MVYIKCPLSIHAPARGAIISHFDIGAAVILSIHAPARGAINYSSILSTANSLSIHAPARGAIFPSICLGAIVFPFQSTLPHGERYDTVSTVGEQVLLSIHAPARGAMYRMDHPGMRMQLSIHAPARGAIDRFYISVFKGFFQSTLPHGER